MPQPYPAVIIISRHVVLAISSADRRQLDLVAADGSPGGHPAELQKGPHGRTVILAAMPDEAEAAAQVQPRRQHLGKAAAAEGIAQREARNAAQPQPALHRTLDCLGVLQFKPDIEPGEVAMKGALEGRPGTRTRLAKNPRLPQKPAGIRPASCQRVIRGTEHRQFVLDPRNHLQIGMPAVSLDKSEIDRMGRQGVQQGGGIPHLKPHLCLRMAAQELRDDQRCQIVTDRQRRTDVQAADRLVTPQRLVDFGCPVKQFDRLRQKPAAGLVQVERLADAVEETAPPLALQFRKRGTGCRLGQRNLSGGSRNAAMAGDGDENFELAKGEPHICFTCIYDLHNLFYR